MFLLSMHIVIVTLISCAFFLVCLFSKKKKKEEETKEHQHSEDYTTAPEDLSVSILKLHGNILHNGNVLETWAGGTSVWAQNRLKFIYFT